MKMNTTGYDAHRAAKQASSPDVYINANLKPQAESIPDYLRSSQTDQAKHPERIYIMSKANGWLTVDSETRNRKKAYEN